MILEWYVNMMCTSRPTFLMPIYIYPSAGFQNILSFNAALKYLQKCMQINVPKGLRLYVSNRGQEN